MSNVVARRGRLFAGRWNSGQSLRRAAGLPLLLACLLLGGSPLQAQVSVQASAYASLNEAVAAAGLAQTTLLIDTPVALAGDLIVPENILLRFTGSGAIDPAAYALTLDCGVEAGSRQIFLTPAQVRGRIRSGAVLPQWFGARGDGETDDTAALQAALDLGASNRIRIPWGRAFYRAGPLFVRSGSVVEFAQGSGIEAISGIEDGNSLINISGVENVSILGNGATIKMQKSEYVSGEHRHGVDIVGSRNVSVVGVVSRDSGGDGFYIGPYRQPEGMQYSESVRIEKCTAINNKRQGLSIVSGRNILVNSCVFEDTIGTDPQSGVDIEPDSEGEIIVNVVFKDCVARGNEVAGFAVVLGKLNLGSAPFSVSFVNCLAMNNKYGFHFRCLQPTVRGEVTLVNSRAEGNQIEDYLYKACDSERSERLKVRVVNEPSRLP